MARTITEVQNQIISAFQADANLAAMDSGSATAIWRLVTRVVAASIVALEVLYDAFVVEVSDVISIQKPHTKRWYQAKCLDYQHGFDLVDGEDYYDNTGFEVDQIQDAKIIAQAAVEEVDGLLIIKVNTEQTGELVPLGTPEYNAFSAYIGEVKDAGVKVLIRSANADKFKMDWDVYYDPLIIGPDGSRLDGSAVEPIRDAIIAYLRNLPFNGIYVKAHHVDFIQALEGVFVPEVRGCLAARYDTSTFQSVDVSYNTFSGFLRFYDDADLVINYIANV